MSNKIRIHENILKKEIFFNSSKWPHFDLLFEDIKSIAKKAKSKRKKVLILERTNLYGGVSLFLPFFDNNLTISVDCFTEKLLSRGNYNNHLLNNKDLIKKKSKYQFHYQKIKIQKNSYDYVLITNLMHHISEPGLLIKKVKNILRKNGSIYIFEPLVRELHQIPEDYYRYTPYGLKKLLENEGFKVYDINLVGGPFTCAYYYLDQSIQYLPQKLRENYQSKIKNEFKKLTKLEKKFKKNLVRKNTKSPTAFSITAIKN